MNYLESIKIEQANLTIKLTDRTYTLGHLHDAISVATFKEFESWLSSRLGELVTEAEASKNYFKITMGTGDFFVLKVFEEFHNGAYSDNTTAKKRFTETPKIFEPLSIAYHTVDR